MVGQASAYCRFCHTCADIGLREILHGSLTRPDSGVRDNSLVRFKVFARSGGAVEAAGPNDTLLVDKSGMITIGDCQATAFVLKSG